MAKAKKNSNTEEPIEKQLWKAADKLRKNIDAASQVLPKVYARGNLDPKNLGGLIDLVGNIALGDAKARRSLSPGKIAAIRCNAKSHPLYY